MDTTLRRSAYLMPLLGMLAVAVVILVLYAERRADGGRGLQKRTMADMRSIAGAIEAYRTDMNRYPEASTLHELVPQISPKYLRAVPRQDAWRNDFAYESWRTPDSATADHFAIGSAGKDRKFERRSLQLYPPGATTNFNNDIIFRDGQFVVYPEGTVVPPAVGLAEVRYPTPRATKPGEPPAQSLFDQATGLYRNGQYAPAIPLFKQFLQTNPDHALAQARLGLSYCEVGEYSFGITHLQKAIALDPADYQSRNNLALAYEIVHRPELGIEVARQAVTLQPRDSTCNNTLGLVLLRSNRPEEAIPPLETAVASAPANKQAHYNLAIAYQRTGRKDRATAEVESLRKLDVVSARKLQEELSRLE